MGRGFTAEILEMNGAAACEPIIFLGTLLSSFAPYYSAQALARVVTGVGIGMIIPAAPHLTEFGWPRTLAMVKGRMRARVGVGER